MPVTARRAVVALVATAALALTSCRDGTLRTRPADTPAPPWPLPTDYCDRHDLEPCTSDGDHR